MSRNSNEAAFPAGPMGQQAPSQSRVELVAQGRAGSKAVTMHHLSDTNEPRDGSMASILIVLLLTAGLVYIAAAYGLPVVLFVFPKHVRHQALPAQAPPEGPLVRQAAELGFAFLGCREERLGPWRRRSWCFVRPDGVCLDLVDPERLAKGYLATFWRDGAAVLTKFGRCASVRKTRYVSTCTDGANLPQLLAEHHRAEQSLSPNGERTIPRSIEERIGAARVWWSRHARTEYLLPAILGLAATGAALALWLHGVVQVAGL